MRPPPGRRHAARSAAVVLALTLLSPGRARAQSRQFDDALQEQEQTSRAPSGAPGPAPAARSDVTGPLLTWGIVTLSVGYGIAVIGGGVALGFAASENSDHDTACAPKGGLNFIPLFGPLLFAASYPDHQVVGYTGPTPYLQDCNSGRGIVQGIVATSEILQLGGTGLIATALVMRALTPDVPIGQSGVLRVFPGAAGVPTGLTLQIQSF